MATIVDYYAPGTEHEVLATADEDHSTQPGTNSWACFTVAGNEGLAPCCQGTS